MWYFLRMFQPGFVESENSEIVLKDFDADTLSSLLEFIYTAKITITEENAQVADMFLMCFSLYLSFTFVFEKLDKFKLKINTKEILIRVKLLLFQYHNVYNVFKMSSFHQHEISNLQSFCRLGHPDRGEPAAPLPGEGGGRGGGGKAD